MILCIIDIIENHVTEHNKKTSIKYTFLLAALIFTVIIQ